MIEYRVTKYNPALRDVRGAYIVSEWTSIKDIGRAFCGVVLTEHEYRRVEQAYIDSALAFLREGGLTALTVEDWRITSELRPTSRKGQFCQSSKPAM